MFTESDLKQFSEKNIDVKAVELQIENFKTGFPFAEIIAPATIENGSVIKLSEEELKNVVLKYEKSLNSEKVVKFVPASGAASRMFKDLFTFIEKYNGSENIHENSSYKVVSQFFKSIKDFAFYEDLSSICKKNNVVLEKEYVKTLELLLTEKGLNYGNLPKGLLKFHKYTEKSRTPIEEHLSEGANYGNSMGKVPIHFTVSLEHIAIFEEHVKAVLIEHEKRNNVKFEIIYSIQKPSTDTIAVEINNIPFRNTDGTLLFRPAGHGALIENLNEIDADIIFVKNIDNVVPEHLSADTNTYKKAIAGLLIEKRTKIFQYINELENSTDEKLINEVINFLQKEFSVFVDNEFSTKNENEKRKYLLRKLNRPIRVCGMVKNEGEPGGGPFLVKAKSGSVSLQIIEGSQIDINNPEKVQIVNNATHFNPVDLVLSVKDSKGNKFDLRKFVDQESGFISTKSKDGKDLKAMELPGLWNGAMAFWNTIFVEIPISTFNPVKVVNDLLRPQHQ